MSDISHIASTSSAPGAKGLAGARNGSANADRTHRTTPLPPARADHVELSQHAQLLSRLTKLPDVRTHLVDRVRAEIAEGTYETPEKINTAIDRLAEDL